MVIHFSNLIADLITIQVEVICQLPIERTLSYSTHSKMAVLLAYQINSNETTYFALAVILALGTLIYTLLNRTDIPKIKDLPELPGVPVFGSLFLLGRYHARNCAKLAQQYGPVFQVRLGSRVRSSNTKHESC